MSARKITTNDILSLNDYAEIRKQRKIELRTIKQDRRAQIGPDCSAYFECFATMLHQVQEMLFIEKGGAEQLEDELRAYNPLIPNGRELVATVMFEITDEIRRSKFLATIGGIEETMFLEFDGERIQGQAEEDVDRTNAAGKASSVQFIHFPFTDDQAQKFKADNCKALLGFTHDAYGHMVTLPAATQVSLARDLD